MNPEIHPEAGSQAVPQAAPEPPQVAPADQNIFWVLLAVFAVLALDAAFRLSDLLAQRSQLDQARFVQAQNIGKLAEGQQAQARLQMLSYEVFQMASTNEGARKIVQDFNIRFTPGASAASASVPVAAPASPPPAPASAPMVSAGPRPASSNLMPAAGQLVPASTNPPPAR